MTSLPAPIPPGSTLGILGSGQLGRMLALVARRMGYRVHTFSPERATPTGQVAELEAVAPYEDLAAVAAFARGVDVVTFEFENVPAAAAAAAAAHVPVRPAGQLLHVTQHRLREKRFLAAAGFPVTPFEAVASAAELAAALARLGCPAVLKSAGFGYDGKGQVRIAAAAEAPSAWQRLGEKEAVLEAFVDFEREISVVVARDVLGNVATFGPIENRHHRHVLDLSAWPARVSERLAAEALELAHGIGRALELVGVLCVEAFATRDGRLLVNELAPRPHNSGHLTIEAAVTSQFEQQLRAVCALPLGSAAALCPAAAMANLLGDLWVDGEPDWAAAARFPEVKLHLYGKAEARPGRKMGHLTATGSSPEAAAARVLAARRALAPRLGPPG